MMRRIKTAVLLCTAALSMSALVDNLVKTLPGDLTLGKRKQWCGLPYAAPRLLRCQ